MLVTLRFFGLKSLLLTHLENQKDFLAEELSILKDQRKCIVVLLQAEKDKNAQLQSHLEILNSKNYFLEKYPFDRCSISFKNVVDKISMLNPGLKPEGSSIDRVVKGGVIGEHRKLISPLLWMFSETSNRP